MDKVIEPSDSIEEEFSDDGELLKTSDVISLCLEHNIKVIDGKLVSFKLSSRNLTSDGNEVLLVENPTASHINHKLLHPSLYRNVKNLGSLDDFARLIGAPDSWSEIFEIRVKGNRKVMAYFNAFRNLPDDAPEVTIKAKLTCLTLTLSFHLGFPVNEERETQIIVGGLLARDEFDIRGQADPYYSNFDGDYAFATEVKTHESFGEGHAWYHKSRAAQIFCALFAFNCPIFLLTHRQWKLFVENPYRTSVLTFPYNSKPSYSPQLASTLVQPMGSTFLKH